MSGVMLAFSGKGGSGKTTLAAMVLRELIREGRGPVLAVDADPNATLGLLLGVEPERTIADLRDDMGDAAQKPGEIPKERLLDMWLAELISEQAGFDLLTMGHPEGPKCYCYVNNLLRRYLKSLRDNYPYVIVDCEAGMEYLSRLTVDKVDALILVAEPTSVGRVTVRRIAELVDSLPIHINRRILALNKIGQYAPAEGGDETQPEVPGVQAVIRVPFDEDLARRSVSGEKIDGSAGPKARAAVEELTRYGLGLAPQPAIPKA